MKIFSLRDASNKDTLGVLLPSDSSRYIDLCATESSIPVSLLELITIDPNFALVAKAMQSRNPVTGQMADITFRILIERPGKIVCMGLNYADHAKEGGNARPDYPSFFMRGPNSLTAHEAPIIRPTVSDKLDYEAELAFVVRTRAHQLNQSNALSCIAGYSIFNDGSIRDYQRKTTQWTIGKNFDQTGAFGPWLVTPDDLPQGAGGLQIQSRLNGMVMQDANTTDFLWGVAETLVLITECMTLEPGDVVITGTPAGVGYAKIPPVFMKPGDICEVEIEGIGILRNSIQDAR
jgi:2-keto-4-pentenoate hydratase/2-oxohepta-3-ene-1,7-dioic acid hydratase in catechol pathway